MIDQSPAVASPSPIDRLRQWLYNVGSGYAATVISGAVVFVMTPQLVNFLGVEAYAIWLLGHTIVFYLRFLDLGFDSAQVRYQARFAARGHAERLQQLLATTTVSMTIAGVIAATLGVLIALSPASWWLDISRHLEADFRTVVLILAVQVLIAFPGSILDNLYEGAQRFDLRNLRAIAMQLLTAVVQLVLLRRGHGIIALAAVKLAMTSVEILVDSAILSRVARELMHVRIKFFMPMWRRTRRFAMWSFADDLLADGSANLDQLLVVTLLPLAMLTQYSLCLTLAGLLMAVTHPITETILPMAAAMHARGQRLNLARLMTMGTKLVVAITAPLMLFLAVFGEPLLGLWIPQATENLSPLLIPTVVVSHFISVYLWIPTILLMAVNRVRAVVMLTVMELILAVGLIVTLVPKYGVVGMAIGSLAANMTMGFFFQVPLACKVIGQPPLRLIAASLGRILLAAIPAAVIAIWMRTIHPDPSWLSLACKGAIVGITYLVGLFLLGTTRQEREEYKALWHSLQDTPEDEPATLQSPQVLSP